MAKQQSAPRKRARSKDQEAREPRSGGRSSGSKGTRNSKGSKGSGDEVSAYEQELTELLAERIKPGLNRGSIPLLARSLAKDIARRQSSGEAEEDGTDAAGDDAAHEEDREDEPRSEAVEQDEPVEDDEPVDDEDPEDEVEDEDDEPVDDEDPEDEVEDEDDEPEEDEEPVEDENAEPGEVTAFEDEMHELQKDLGDDWIVRFSVQGDEAWLTAEKTDGSQHVEAPTADVLREAVDLLDEGGGRSD